jgi:hypothetical protein
VIKRERQKTLEMAREYEDGDGMERESYDESYQ